MSDLDPIARVRRIAELKKLARQQYLAYDRERDRFGDGCGGNLAAVISPAVYRHADAWNRAMAELKQIDPDCPNFTPLPTGA